jgi:cyclopropane-fatty-acyl-phospholipid synthase
MQKKIFHNFFTAVQSAGFEVRYWDGSVEKYGQEPPSFTLTFNKKLPFYKWIRQPSMSFCEAYVNGTIDIRGSMDEILRIANTNKKKFFKTKSFSSPKAKSKHQQKKNVEHHYDLGNDFYSLWLDLTMSYSCAYFKSPNDSLEQAQLQKIDHTLKKLQLQPGETLLDIGSGWGWLMIRAAQQYGVKATGITLSEEQYKKTRELVKELNLENQVDVEIMDYRDLAKSGRKFDKIASVGMFEHAGRENFPAYMKSVQSLLNDQGVMLLHTITRPLEEPVHPWITTNIFPGGYIPSLREIIHQLPEYDFHTMDVENLRMHYAKTLEQWVLRYSNHVEKVRDMYGERFNRMWKLYLLTSASSFRIGGLHLHQILFSKGINNTLNLTRDHIYK